MGRTLKVTLALIAVLAVYPQVASASTPQAINGKCGMHWGALLSRNSGGSTYHARVGPEVLGNSASAWICKGEARMVRTGKAGRSVLAWVPYTLPNFNWKGAIEIGTAGFVTGTACVEAGGAVAVAIESGGTLASLSLTQAGAAAGCATGAAALFSFLPDGPSDITNVRMIK